MTTGAPPPNLTFDFQSSKRIPPSFTVQTRLYNEAGYIAHPLQQFGRPGGVVSGYARVPVAGVTGLAPGMPAFQAAGTHTINGREPGTNY